MSPRDDLGCELPAGSTLGPRRALDYYHRADAELPVALGPLAAWNMMTSERRPLLALAFRIRDSISARFGVKRIGGLEGPARAQVAAGEMLGFFRVEHADDRMLVLTERDRHLDVMTTLLSEGRRLSIISSVITHNADGRVYMLPVGIAHRVIVYGMLRRLQKRLAG